jgi:hypothetical protein
MAYLLDSCACDTETGAGTGNHISEVEETVFTELDALEGTVVFGVNEVVTALNMKNEAELKVALSSPDRVEMVKNVIGNSTGYLNLRKLLEEIEQEEMMHTWVS